MDSKKILKLLYKRKALLRCIYLDFLSQLRAGYIDRDLEPTFKSVILAGVYDIKNLKHKLRNEDEGRRYFLLYLRPIINGTGNYYIESHTRDLRRTDIIVDYLGNQYIIEMKIWHGDEYNNRGEKQLADYLDSYHSNTGYMLRFNFNKKKHIGIHEIIVDDKKIIEAVV